MSEEHDLNNSMAALGIEEEENASFVLEGDIEEDFNRYDLCLVGKLLTQKNINVRAMKTKIADVWRPAMGLSIKELDQGTFLFQFYRSEDLQWIMKGGPWTFDNVMLALEQVAPGENPKDVKPCFLSIWIQVYNLPMGFMLESVGKQLGNFFGVFKEYDGKNNTSIWREYMRIRIKLDVRKPLKRKKKIMKKDGTEFTVTCKYERLGEFCFSCGMVTHTDRFCRNSTTNDVTGEMKEWGSWLKAPPRRAAGQTQSKWLREEGDDTWESRIGQDSNYQQNHGGKFSNANNEIRQGSDSRELVGRSSKFVNKGSSSSISANLKGFNTTSNLLFGLNEEESEILQLEERKRRRGESGTLGQESTEVGHARTGPNEIFFTRGAIISSPDLTAPADQDMAELAMQASQQK